MPAADAIDWLTKIDYRRVELSFDYQFQDPRHLIGVLFAGQPGMPVDAYQRQEWLGDSVLGLLVMKYWSKLGVSMRQMGPLVCQTVSNRFFGSIACLLLGSEKYFMSCEANFQSTLGAIVSRLELRDIKPKTWKYGPDLPPLKLSTMTMDDLLPYLLRRAAFERTHGRAPFWTKLGCPKSGGDMMEAIFGAIYEDSGFDYGAVTAVFKRTIQVILDIFFAETLPEPFDVLASAMKRMGCNAWSITRSVRRPIITRSTALMNNQNANVTTVSKRQHEEENLDALVTKRLRLTDTALHMNNHTDQSASETPNSSTLQEPLSSFPTPTVPRPAKHVQVVKMHNHIIAKASGSTVVEAWAAAVQKAIRVVDEHPHYANMNCTCKHIKC
ncbi:Dicer-like protein 1 [Actinomortierella wolfii]|nr:Dicer-like protein 1 [Actinomortierella wolfii]